MTPHAPKRTGDAKGRWAETLCAWALRLRGYTIFARRFRSGLGEIDIVALRGQTLAFIEVKYRAAADEALEAVGTRQRQRIMAAANHFLARHPQFASKHCRFDIITVAPWQWPRHHKNMWTA